jgi:hypothetical protein
MKTILYLIRTEADFERVNCLAISGKDKFRQNFIFAGDFSPFFDDGIQNKFQKYLFKLHGFEMHNLINHRLILGFMLRFTGNRILGLEDIAKKPRLLAQWVLLKLLLKYYASRKTMIVQRMLKKIKPDVLFTDQSSEDENYLPEIIRAEAHKRGVKVYIFPHGAAGGLHYHFSNPKYGEYANYTVLASNELEASQHPSNRLVTGDMSSSYPYVLYLNSLDEGAIDFLNERPYKVAFMVGGTIQSWTSTNAWSIQEEIIIRLSERPDVAMVLKLHPREASHMDLRMLKTFDNLLIVNKETDRSRVSKWADIVVCNDHTSVIFEPMILGKKVVAIEGIHTPNFWDIHSPLKESSILHITSAADFHIMNIADANPLDPVIDEVAWGGNGTLNLAELALKNIG